MLLGNAVALATTVTDPSGTATDPATLTLVVTKPDATTDTFNIGALTHGGTGVYSYLYTPLASGFYRYQWTATVPSFSSDGLLEVDAETATALTLVDAKRHLGVTETSHDAVIQDLVNAAVGVIEGLIGPITPKTYTETYSGGNYTIVLRHTPVISVTTVTENWGTINYTLTNQPVGQATDAYGYDLENPYSGTLARRTVGSFPFPFFAGEGNIAVTYVAGRSSVPPDVKLALIRQLRLLWADYQSGRTTGKQSQSGPLPLVDPYIADLLGPHMLMPGIA